MGETENSSGGRLYRFGVFEADERTRELRKQGRRLALQGQPVQVLLMLLEKPGELVTRGEIQQRLWPDGTFVDFDHGLNTAINKIRDALGDSASKPRFIETLARRGYRFVASLEKLPVERTPSEKIEQETNANEIAAATRLEKSTDSQPAPAVLPSLAERILTGPEEAPPTPHRVVLSLFFLLHLMYLCFYVASLARLNQVEEIVGAATRAHTWMLALIIVTAAVGIPVRLYLISCAVFRSPLLRQKFLRLFPIIFPFDELWALAPFLLVPQIGFGLALAATAALLYSPFAQRSLILMSTVGTKP